MRSLRFCIAVALIVFRSWDGLTLYAVSSDGTLAAFCFDSDELEGIAPHSIQQQYLQKFGFTLPPLPEGWSHTSLQLPSPGNRITPPPSPNRSSHPPHGLNGFGAPSANIGHEVVNTLIAKRNTKRRTQSLGPRGVSNSAPVYTSSAGAKRKSSVLDTPEDRPTKARTLGGDRVRDSNLNIIKEICSPINQRTVVPGDLEVEIFAAPPVLTYLSLKLTDTGDDILECKNAESGGSAVFGLFLCSTGSSPRDLRSYRSQLYQWKNCMLA